MENEVTTGTTTSKTAKPATETEMTVTDEMQRIDDQIAAAQSKLKTLKKRRAEQAERERVAKLEADAARLAADLADIGEWMKTAKVVLPDGSTVPALNSFTAWRNNRNNRGA